MFPAPEEIVSYQRRLKEGVAGLQYGRSVRFMHTASRRLDATTPLDQQVKHAPFLQDRHACVRACVPIIKYVLRERARRIDGSGL